MKTQLRRHWLPFAVMALLLCVPAQSPAVNVIVMIADGWGYNQVAAADYWNGTSPDYELWTVAYPMSTYMRTGGYDHTQAWIDFNYAMSGSTDSAAAATAMSTGVKTDQGVIGMSYDLQPLEHVIERAEILGMATGVITSVEWSHATPAGFVAHNASRGNYEQIAQEMVHTSSVDVIMGAGHPLYGNDGVSGVTPDYKYVGGTGTWDELVAGTAGGDADGDGNPDPWTLIQTRAEFQSLAAGSTPDRVLGTAQVRLTLQQKRLGGPPANSFQAPYTAPLLATVPTLEEMTLAALNVLDNDPDGFFLMIEGGAIDWANHANQLGRMIEEMDDFNNAFDAVVSWVEVNSNWDETLVIVTGDHETGYLWGPGSGLPATFNPIVDNGQGSMPGFYYFSGGHTKSLIPLFAKGIGSDQFEQYAANIDPTRGAYIDNINVADVIFHTLDSIVSIMVNTFEALALDQEVRLTWNVNYEDEIMGFNIYRSSDRRKPGALVNVEGLIDRYTREYVDHSSIGGRTYFYSLGVVMSDNSETIYQTARVTTRTASLTLHQNYPNPFNPSTRVGFDVDRQAHVVLSIYDLTGRLVRTLVNQKMDPGRYVEQWDGRDTNGDRVASGIYFYRLVAGNKALTRKAVIIK